MAHCIAAVNVCYNGCRLQLSHVRARAKLSTFFLPSFLNYLPFILLSSLFFVCNVITPIFIFLMIFASFFLSFFVYFCIDSLSFYIFSLFRPSFLLALIYEFKCSGQPSRSTRLPKPRLLLLKSRHTEDPILMLLTVNIQNGVYFVQK